MTQKRYERAQPKAGVSFTHAPVVRGPAKTEVRGRCARMKVLLGIDPHKASVTVAAVDELGELIECV